MRVQFGSRIHCGRDLGNRRLPLGRMPIPPGVVLSEGAVFLLAAAPQPERPVKHLLTPANQEFPRSSP